MDSSQYRRFPTSEEAEAMIESFRLLLLVLERTTSVQTALEGLSRLSPTLGLGIDEQRLFREKEALYIIIDMVSRRPFISFIALPGYLLPLHLVLSPQKRILLPRLPLLPLQTSRRHPTVFIDILNQTLLTHIIILWPDIPQNTQRHL